MAGGAAGVTFGQPHLSLQDLATLDVTKLTPLSHEVISRQATINIGTIGHVAHGKSTLVKAISGVHTARFKNELERNITIKLGYANAKKNYLTCNWSMKSIFGSHKGRHLQRKREKKKERKKKGKKERTRERKKEMTAVRKMKGTGAWLQQEPVPGLLWAMSKPGAMGRCRPFLGAVWRRLWRRPLMQWQHWLPDHKGAGCATMGLTRLQRKVFAGQTKIFAYVSPNKCSGMRYPLQEENSFAHHEFKCQGKPLSGIFRKPEEKRNAGNMIQSSMMSDEQKIKEARRGPVAPFPNQNSEAAEPPKPPPPSCGSTNTVAAKQAMENHLKGKQAPQKKSQGKTQQNRKLTDFHPVRRSSRKSRAELQSEEKKKIDELIESGKEEGLKVELIDGKGRGVIATKQFSRGDFVVEYHGDLLEITDAKKREAVYAQDPSTGCYMYYFQYLSKTYCVDATRETNRLGRLINHSKYGNCKTKLHDINSVPHLILFASRDIAIGEEILFDYGDRSKASIEAYPWLKY